MSKTSTVCLLSISGSHYAIPTAAKAAALVSALNSMEEVVWDHDEQGSYFRIPEAGERFARIELKFGVEVFPRRRFLGLPAPSSESSPDPSNINRG